ncbi:MAG: DNA recombination protein RmuC [Melioribacteraceae bacterium]|nr:DNA recombination protein RmuC [Melioribacteraceae bacterium]
MNEYIYIITLALVLITLVLLWLTYKKISSGSQSNLKEELDRVDKSFRDELTRNRDELSKVSKSQREELSSAIKLFGDQLYDQLTKLIQTNEQKFEKLQDRIEIQLKEIQENNSKKLEEMRQTVDEKLHDTLEKRLGESFKLVSDRLEQVYKGLGDMQDLARGVGDLKNVLSNVKTRGGWGEIQLENLIDQILTREQYEKNIITKKGSSDRVEIGIKLPGRDVLKNEIVWLPIDAKFPVEDYQRLLEAQDMANIAAINDASKAIETRIKGEAKKIADKYLDPPHTTDFAVMFLPIEGLYAEVLRRPGLAEFLQREYRVVVSGPTTLAALLNSLQMGFRTLAIEKRSSEVWKILSGVKKEFENFGKVLDKTQKKLQEASNTIDEAAKSSRKIERQLKDVQGLPSSDESKLIE